MWFTSTEKYEREVEDPDSGEKAMVTFRPLNAGDRAEIEDTLRMELGADASPQMRLGTMRMLTIRRAVVDWTIPGPKPSPEAIAQLHPFVYEQLWDHTSFGAVPPTQPSEETGDSTGPADLKGTMEDQTTHELAANAS